MEERIFSWSLDGFGSKLFRITDNRKERFLNRYSSMEISEKDKDVLFNNDLEFYSFEEFWKEFTAQPLWLHYHPIFIHEDYKPFLQDFFSNINLRSLTMSDQFSLILWLHKIEPEN